MLADSNANIYRSGYTGIIIMLANNFAQGGEHFCQQVGQYVVQQLPLYVECRIRWLTCRQAGLVVAVNIIAHQVARASVNS